MNNLDIYEQSRKVPIEAQKNFDNGSFKGTDINPMWRIKKLTELFGPAGIGWYTEIISERFEEHSDHTMAIVDINLYVKIDGEWSKPIFGTGGNSLAKAVKSGMRTSDEGYKMAYTDALSVACKALGIGADIYWGSDKTKYSQYETPNLEMVKADTAPVKPVQKSASSPANINSTRDRKAEVLLFCATYELKNAEFTALYEGYVRGSNLDGLKLSELSDADYRRTMNELEELMKGRDAQ